jgi:hypothetical protein
MSLSYIFEISNQQERHQHFGQAHKTSVSYVAVQGNLVPFFFQSFNQYLSTFPLGLMQNK